MTITLEPRKVLTFLLSVIALLSLAGFAVVISTHVFDHGRLYGFARLFHFNRENNIPSYFSALQLGFAALLLLAIASQRRMLGDRFHRQWTALGLVFCYLSVDEAASLHEMLILPMEMHFSLTGVWAFAWYVPYGLLLAGFAAAFARFFFHLPREARIGFAVAGTVFLTGAVGLEMLSAHFFTHPDWEQSVRAFRVALTYSVEEPLEMIGIALFVYTLLRYAASSGLTAHIGCAYAAHEQRDAARTATMTA